MRDIISGSTNIRQVSFLECQVKIPLTADRGTNNLTSLNLIDCCLVGKLDILLNAIKLYGPGLQHFTYIDFTQFSIEIVQALSKHPLTSVCFGGFNATVEKMILLAKACSRATKWKLDIKSWGTKKFHTFFAAVGHQMIDLDLSSCPIRPIQLPLQDLKNVEKLAIYLNRDFKDTNWPLKDLKLINLPGLNRIDLVYITPDDIIHGFSTRPEISLKRAARMVQNMEDTINQLHLPFACQTYESFDHFHYSQGKLKWDEDFTSFKLWKKCLGPCLDFGCFEAELGDYSGKTIQKMNHYRPKKSSVLPGADIYAYQEHRVGHYFETFQEDLPGYFSDSDSNFYETDYSEYSDYAEEADYAEDAEDAEDEELELQQYIFLSMIQQLQGFRFH